MITEVLEAAADVGDAAVYGRRGQTRNFGRALYHIKEEKRKCCFYVAEIATFYQDFVVINNTKQFCCFPPRYGEKVIPKYKLVGATVRRGVNFFSIGFGMILAFTSLVLMISGALIAGVSCLGPALLLLLLPLCLARYYTELQVTGDPDDPATPMCGYTSYYLRTFQKPDDDFIMLYVYGALHHNMPGYHALAHLVGDNLVSKVQPRLMSSIQIDAEQLPAPAPEPLSGVRESHDFKNKGYGKQLYSLEHTHGPFGNDGFVGSCGTCLMSTTARHVFCENLLVFGKEHRVLCYPTTYEKMIIPKYRIAKCEFRRGGAIASLKFALVMFSVGGTLLGSGGATKGAGETCQDVCSGGCGFYGLSCIGYDCASCQEQIDSGQSMITAGILVLLPGLVLSIIACFTSMFMVDLIMGASRSSKTNPWRKFIATVAGPETYSIALHREPDKEFIMEYVYGTLSKNMGGYHALTHLIKDDLIEPPEPRTTMGAIASTGIKSYMPVAPTRLVLLRTRTALSPARSTRSDHTSTSADPLAPRITRARRPATRASPSYARAAQLRARIASDVAGRLARRACPRL